MLSAYRDNKKVSSTHKAWKRRRFNIKLRGTTLLDIKMPTHLYRKIHIPVTWEARSSLIAKAFSRLLGEEYSCYALLFFTIQQLSAKASSTVLIPVIAFNDTILTHNFWFVKVFFKKTKIILWIDGFKETNLLIRSRPIIIQTQKQIPICL